MSDNNPAVPPDFPFDLKKLVMKGWCKDFKERPSIQEFNLALNKMLPGKEEKNRFNSLTLQAPTSSYEKGEQQQVTHEELRPTENYHEEKGESNFYSLTLPEIPSGQPIMLFTNNSKG